MKKCNVIGLDIAKNSFEVCMTDLEGNIIERKTLNRKRVLEYFAKASLSSVGLEACAGAHYWARQIESLGHEVRLIAPQHVKPFVLGNKNDSKDAYAISRCLREPNIPYVPIGSTKDQDLRSLHRVRQRFVSGRTALVNQIRGLLLEYGISMSRGIDQARREVKSILQEPAQALSGIFLRLLQEQYSELLDKDDKIKAYTALIKKYVQEDPAAVRVMKISGIGPITASYLLIKLRHTGHYKNGRHFAASLGLVPRHEGTGGLVRLKGISKRGDTYLRTLLIHGARNEIRFRDRRQDNLGAWIRSLVDRRGFNKACVALANKHARIAWRVITHNQEYNPAYASSLGTDRN